MPSAHTCSRCTPPYGSLSATAEDVVRLLPTIGDGVTLAALPDTVAPPWLLRPWFEGDRDVR